MIGPFRGKYRFLSNFYTCRVEYEGIVYQSSEHAYQAAKSLDVEVRKQATEPRLKEPRDVKHWGSTIQAREDWDAVKVDVMTDILRIKFSNPYLRGQLLATGNEELVEVNYWGDDFWGVFNTMGQNQLGKALMKIRQEIREPNASDPQKQSPSRIEEIDEEIEQRVTDLWGD